MLASHPLMRGGSLAAWYASGFPNYTDDFGFQAEDLPWRGGRLAAGAGDLLVAPLEPEAFEATARDAYPLRGGSLGYRSERHQWGFFAGQPKYPTRRPGAAREPDWLAGGGLLARAGRYHLGGGVTLVQEPAEAGRDGGTAAVLETRAFRTIWPGTELFAELSSTDRGGLGCSLGARHRFSAATVSGEAYGFGSAFPAASPLFRPGERGIRVSGDARAGASFSAFGSVDLVDESLLGDRSHVRGYAGVGYGPEGLPLDFQLVHDRARQSFDSRSIVGSSSASDRTTLRARYGRGAEFLDVSAEHVTNDRAGGPDRDQLYAFYRRLLGIDSLIDGSLVVQRSDPDDRGVTAESSLERPLAGRLSWLGGLGAAYVDRAGDAQGEGALRLGLIHRPQRDGLYLRVEARIPFSIGMERSHLAARSLTFDVGRRFEWQGGPRDVTAGRRRPTGLLAGRVMHDDVGLPGLPVIVDGVRRTVTRRDGSYRVRGVPTGEATVRLDIRSLDPRYAPRGGATRTLTVAHGRNTLDFTIEAYSYFQGSIVRCDGDRLAPVSLAGLVLEGPGFEREARTTRLGGFQFDGVPPGEYELTVTPEKDDPTGDPVRFTVDLGNDLPGQVLRLGCDDAAADGPVRLVGARSGEGERPAAADGGGATEAPASLDD